MATAHSVAKNVRVPRNGGPNGFSHPARFEVLERRLTLNIAPGTTEFGFQSPATGVVIEQGLFSLPGAASPTNGTNPANYALVDSTGTQIPDTHVTAPGTFDAMRPPMPGWYLPPEILPINLAQVASMPYGIRNFEIGANTGLRHGNTSPMGRGDPTARDPAETRTAMGALLGDPNESLRLKLNDSDFSQLANASALSSRKPLSEGSESSDHSAAALNDRPPPAEVAQAVEFAPAEKDEPNAPVLDAAAVDQTMATIDTGTKASVEQASEPVDAETTDDRASAGEAAHALAASIAAGAVFVAQEPESRNVASIGVGHRQ